MSWRIDVMLESRKELVRVNMNLQRGVFWLFQRRNGT